MALPAILRLINAVWCIAVIGYIAWGWYAYAGLYRMAAEWQMAQFGSYRVLLTALLPALVLMLPSFIVAVWLQRASGTIQRAPADPRRGLWAITVAGLVALAVAALAGALGYQKLTRTPLLAELDLRKTASLPQADRFVITGLARTDLMLSLETETRGARRNYAYIPLTPPDWRRGQSLTFFLRTDQNAWLPPGGGALIRLAPGQAPFLMTTQPAVIESHNLPGPVREAYRTHNIALDRQLYVFSQDTAAELEHYWITAGVGGLVGLACLAAAGITALRLHRRR